MALDIDPANPASEAQELARARGAAKLGIWAFLATEILLFGGLFTLYTVFRIKYPELFHAEHLKLNRVMGLTNTVVLISSSLTVATGIAAIRRGRNALMKACYAATILLAGVFLVIKYFEWTEDFAQGLLPSTNIFFSLYFSMTGLHGLHVIGGICALSVVLFWAERGDFARGYHTPVEIVGIYWHFVDLIWIYLFPLLYLAG
ncbi:MAG TPA: cytochrome c oxidase subunit 3 family protein [Nitrospirota bacterium]